MKVNIIQPYYSMNYKDVDKCFNEYIKFLDKCDKSADIIVLPEYSDVPVSTPSEKEFKKCIRKYNKTIMNKAIETAKRCNAIVFVNCAYKTETGYRNTTHAIDRSGKIVGRYFKSHPAPSEVKTAKEGGNELDVSYMKTYKPYIVEIEGIRFGFMTCYDFYFYEDYIKLARENVDIIIGCSHQRSDTHEALEIIGKFLSYNTNAYLVRSAVSLGKKSKICGSSMVVAPNGEMILNMKSKIGIGKAKIDPKKKYLKPAGFKGAPKAHWQDVDEGRKMLTKKAK